MCVYVLYVCIDQVFSRLFGGGVEKPENLVGRAVNERSRVRNSYCTLGIQRGGFIIIKG